MRLADHHPYSDHRPARRKAPVLALMQAFAEARRSTRLNPAWPGEVSRRRASPPSVPYLESRWARRLRPDARAALHEMLDFAAGDDPSRVSATWRQLGVEQLVCLVVRPLVNDQRGQQPDRGHPSRSATMPSRRRRNTRAVGSCGGAGLPMPGNRPRARTDQVVAKLPSQVVDWTSSALLFDRVVPGVELLLPACAGSARAPALSSSRCSRFELARVRSTAWPHASRCREAGEFDLGPG